MNILNKLVNWYQKKKSEEHDRIFGNPIKDTEKLMEEAEELAKINGWSEKEKDDYIYAGICRNSSAVAHNIKANRDCHMIR